MTLRPLIGALVALALAAPALGIQPGASGSLRIQNGAIDLIETDGGDSSSGTTRATNKPTIRTRRADDCTAQTDGKAGEPCIDDAGGLWWCQPSSGDCDTAAEWITGLRFEDRRLDARSISDSGSDSTPATLTLAPTASYVEVTCSDDDGCDITMSESGAREGRRVTVRNVSSNAYRLKFVDQANVLVLNGTPAYAKQHQSITFEYDGAEWRQPTSGVQGMQDASNIGWSTIFNCVAPMACSTSNDGRLDIGVSSLVTQVGAIDAADLPSTIPTTDNNPALRPYTADQRFNNAVKLAFGTSAVWSLASDGTQLNLTRESGSGGIVVSLAANAAFNIRTATFDGSDTNAITISGGGGAGAISRGSYLTLGGEQGVFGALPGAYIATPAHFRVFVDTDVISQTAKFAVDDGGQTCILTNDCAKDVGLLGTGARSLGVETNAGDTAGQNFTVSAGSALGATASNKNGGTLVLAGGDATGNGTSVIDFQTSDANQGSGTTARAVATRLRLRDGHVVGLGTAPAVSSCGTTPAITGTDTAGKVTFGTGTVTTCTITFAKAYTTNAPACTVTGDDTARRYAATTSTTVLTITTDASAPSDVVSYICIGVE